MISRLTALVLAAAGFASAPVHAAEICHERTGGQYADERMCVSSVLAPQAGNDYGPKNLLAFDDAGGAWCEGAPGPGIGERVTLHMKPDGFFRTIGVTNGYAKNDDTFRRNGRIKRVLIETNRGFKRTVTLKDAREPQDVVIPNTKARWLRLTIVEVYPGTRGTDTCLTGFGVNHEELEDLEPAPR
jgi:hypothetical protein